MNVGYRRHIQAPDLPAPLLFAFWSIPVLASTAYTMSTLAAADLSSDDEHDADFQLPDKPKESRRKRRRSGSDSEGSSSGSGDDTGGVDDLETKQLREEQVAAETAERKKKAEAAFAAMKDQSGSGSSTIAADAGVKERLVEVRRARRFAGDTI